MGKKLKPYKEYKETGLVWLNDVPRHWKVKPNRFLWTERKKTNQVDEKLLSVTIKKGVISQSELLESTSKKDTSNLDKSKYKLVMPNDVVYNKMRMWQGAVGISKYKGIVSPAYIILKPRNEINHKYYHYLLRTPIYVKESYRNSYGICDDQLSLRYEDFKCMYNIIPPKEEQDQIVCYLDSKISKINRFIKAKKKQIKLLREQKRAIINKAVTKGIDPEAKMKPSGIEWLGDIPREWKVRRLKTIVKNISITTEEKKENDIYVGLENIESWSGRIINATPETNFNSKAKKFKEGNILFGKLRPYLAKVTIPYQAGVCSGEILVLETIGTYVFNKFVEYYLRSISVIDLINMSTYGAKMPRAEWDFIGNIKIGLPELNEQQEIVEYLNNKTEIFNKAIDKIYKEIELISEYRTSLISDVVTGKVDVRNIKVEDIIEDVEEDFEDISEENLEDEELHIEEEE